MHDFNKNQKESIAEVAAFDTVLTEIWQEHIAECVKEKTWQPELLLKSMVVRVLEIVDDIESVNQMGSDEE